MTIMPKLRQYMTLPLVSGIVGTFLVGVAAAPARAPRIIQVYATAETTTSVSVVWNTDVAADSKVQYSTANPVGAGAPSLYAPTQATYHEFTIEGLTPGTLYYFRVSSCAKRGCSTASGTFETLPSCPDTVPPVSGRWQKASSPNVGGATPVTNELLGITAVSGNDVWAVGWAQDPSGPPYVKKTLIEHFNGSAWGVVPSPNLPGDTQSELHSVSGASANDVWAVGHSHNGSLPSRTMIQHWNGSQWNVVPSPSPADQLNELRGVAALSAFDAWAVGYSSDSQSASNIDTLILHWDGAQWREVPSPNFTGVANQLFGISAISANDIWAVGAAGGYAIAMHWNGSAWSFVAVAQDAGLSSEVLAAVSGSAANDVWAVGRGKGIFSNQTFATIKRWDGIRWTDKVCYAASSSNPPDGYEGGGPDAYFSGVTAPATNDVWVVGVRGSGPTIRHWDGFAWTTVTHPRAFPNAAALRSVAASSDGSAWSAGIEIEVSPSGSAAPARTLIDRYVP
jgi:hypothetical protein